MAQDYNQQNPDGSWWHVNQDNNGNYTHTVIPDPTTAAPATVAGGITDAHRQALQTAGYSDWQNPNLTEAQYATISAGAQAGAGAVDPTTGLPITGATPEAFNAAYYAAVQTAIDNTVKNAMQAANGQVSAAVAAAQNIQSLISTYGTQAISALHEAGTLGVSVADVMSKLQGPANYTAYDRAATAFRGNGLGNSIQALTSGFAAPTFGAMGPTTPMTLGSVGADVAGIPVGSGTAPTPSTSIIDQLLGIAGTDTTGLNNASKGQVPFSIPQLDANGHVIPGTGGANPQLSTGTAAAGSDGTYQTSNGPKTLAQMLSELDVAAGGKWSGGDRASATAIASAYAHTTGGTVTPPQAPTVAQAATASPTASPPATPVATSTSAPAPPVAANQTANTATGAGAAPTFGTQTTDAWKAAMASGTTSPPGTLATAATGAYGSGINPLLPGSAQSGGPTFGTQPIAGLGSITQQGGPASFGTGAIPYTGNMAYLNQYSPDMQQQLIATPSPNAINPRDYASMSPSAQAQMMSLYGAKGYDIAGLQDQLNKELPTGSQGPKFGLVGP